EEDPVMAVDNGDGFSPEAVLGFESEIQANENEENEEYTAADGAIVTLVNGILERAVNEGMSDIHVEPFEDSLQVRYRLDGILYKSLDLPSDIEYPLTSRLKLLSGLNTRERRAPQDGRFRMRFGKGRPIDFHLSTLPTLHGESVVVRVLNRGVMKVQLAGMGFETKTLETLKRCVSRPQGMILVTGPTDSGKTTTLYNVLNQLNREDVKILTAEDPVEFSFRGISQMHVQEELGMTFSTAVKTFLRQDPDIIMVGEIENPETAKMAIKAAMTGHLVFSTLHTSDGPSTIGRLVDMGIPLYMLASSVKMVLSQRLVRKLCPKCKVLYEAVDPDELESVGFSREDIPGLSIYGPQGCQKCMGTGYRGRIGLYELMEVTDEVGKTIAAGASEDQLRRIAIEEGMVTLREAGLEKIRQGVTSLEEVVMRTVASKEAIPEYLASPVIEHYEDEDSLFQQGDNDADFFMLMQGRLAVVRNGQQLYQIVKPGEYFGLRAAITNAPRSTTVMSKGMSTVRRFPGDKFSEIIVKSPNVAKHLLKTAASRLSRTEDSVVELLQARQGAA
ncbi:MAG: ATPase, T2SS/T4P/T4SS family, partial [Thermodesulfobacteriota bacterium]|nr:ATPase, T2SS/T4P/T4SS family [Thermodesulfobacteriota bacterium]